MLKDPGNINRKFLIPHPFLRDIPHRRILIVRVTKIAMHLVNHVIKRFLLRYTIFNHRSNIICCCAFHLANRIQHLGLIS